MKQGFFVETPTKKPFKFLSKIGLIFFSFLAFRFDPFISGNSRFILSIKSCPYLKLKKLLQFNFSVFTLFNYKE